MRSQTRAAAFLVSLFAGLAVTTSTALAAGASCTFGPEQFGTTNTEVSVQFNDSVAVRIIPGNAFDSIQILDGTTPVSCSGGNPATFQIRALSVFAGASNAQLTVDRTAALGAARFGVYMGDGTDTVTFNGANGLSLGLQFNTFTSRMETVANFDAAGPETTIDNEMSSSLGVERFGGDGSSLLLADGSRNGSGVTPLDLPVTFTAITSGATLRGGLAADALMGGAGPDTIDGGAGADVIAGAGGTDTLSYGSSATPVTVDLASGAGPGGDAFTQMESLTGGNGNDRLSGDAGSNGLDGGGGDDTLDGRDGADIVVGGPGTDTVTYAGAPGAITLDLAVMGAQAGAQGDTVGGIESILGSPFADTLLGSDAADTIDPGPGTDTVDARGGDDAVLVVDQTTDTVTCGAGTDTVTGDVPGTDVLAADCEARSLTDAPPPDTALTGGPPASGLARNATFTFTGTGNSPAFECKLDAESFGSCSSPRTYDGLALGAHTFQVRAKGLDGDLDATPAGTSFIVLPADRDGDGSTEDVDCDDTDPARRPGAKEIAGNKVDEDCKDGARAFTRVVSPVSYTFRKSGTRTRLTRLLVSDLPAGATLVVRCRGPKGSCPFRQVTRKYAKATKKADLLPTFKRRRLKAKTVVEIEISDADAIAKVLRITFSSRKAPTQTLLCRVPGAKIGSCR